MTDTILPLIELQKQDAGDFLRAVAAAALQLLMSSATTALLASPHLEPRRGYLATYHII